jgi:hypothetical protein
MIAFLPRLHSLMSTAVPASRRFTAVVLGPSAGCPDREMVAERQRTVNNNVVDYLDHGDRRRRPWGAVGPQRMARHCPVMRPSTART